MKVNKFMSVISNLQRLKLIIEYYNVNLSKLVKN